MGENDTNQFQLGVNAAMNFLFRIPLGHLTLDSEGRTFLRNAGSRSPKDAASHLRRTESAIRLCKKKKKERKKKKKETSKFEQHSFVFSDCRSVRPLRVGSCSLFRVQVRKSAHSASFVYS